MSKFHSIYICQQCNYQSPTFLGKCPECDSWNSFVEQIEDQSTSKVKKMRLHLRGVNPAGIVNLKDLQKKDYIRLSTGMEEFDRCLGGGVVVGSLVLVSGDPGIGKSTLLTQLALNIKGALYVAGEESARQIKLRVDRISQKADLPAGRQDLAVFNEVDVDLVIEAIRSTKPSLVIVDSIQSLETTDLESIAGSVGQIRECAHRLQKVAKDLHIPIFLVGHVTKEGNLAGPKTLEHVVDVVLSLEGDTVSLFRILRSTKNRFGPTDEVGIFEMEGAGLIEVKNPSKLFLEQKVDAPGSAVVVTASGRRPILVEIQGLVTKSFLPIPRRVGSGIDNNRLQLLVAVLSKRLGLSLFDKDIFINVTGGLKLYEPAVDLGICMAIISSLKDQNIKPRTVFLGEVGLLGELRAVAQIDSRIKEARKLGFVNIISSKNAGNLTQALKLVL
ncbi:MAG: DNA repair protein RadA [Candidatus Daviesbacteria bacterium]|nr:DNA repair protein RadA [Candidatus Daviesbacteria bacterium]